MNFIDKLNQQVERKKKNAKAEAKVLRTSQKAIDRDTRKRDPEEF